MIWLGIVIIHYQVCGRSGSCEECLAVGIQYLEPSTMEGQNFEIPEDPSQTLPERWPMGRILHIYFLKLSRIQEKKKSSRRSWPTSA